MKVKVWVGAMSGILNFNDEDWCRVAVEEADLHTASEDDDTHKEFHMITGELLSSVYLEIE